VWGGFQRDWQVTSGKKYWSDGTPVAGQEFEYAFDDTCPVRYGAEVPVLCAAGWSAHLTGAPCVLVLSHGVKNRTRTKAGGDGNGVGLRSAAYSANNLNQYTSRDVPGAVDVMGIAFATNTVTVNGQAVYRKGEYFRKELSVNNASRAGLDEHYGQCHRPGLAVVSAGVQDCGVTGVSRFCLFPGCRRGLCWPHGTGSLAGLLRRPAVWLVGGARGGLGAGVVSVDVRPAPGTGRGGRGRAPAIPDHPRKLTGDAAAQRGRAPGDPAVAGWRL
jgi:hypothetical protein